MGHHPKISPDQTSSIFISYRRQRTWTWNRAEAKNEEKEYEWKVEIINDKTKYHVTLFHYKFAGNPPQEGDLESLIQQISGTVSFYDAAAKEWVDVNGVVLQTDAGTDRFSMTLVGEDVPRIFSNKPAKALFKSKIPERAEQSAVVPIVYQD